MDVVKKTDYYVEFIDPYGVVDGIKVSAISEEEAKDEVLKWSRGQIKDIYVLEDEV